MSMGIEVGVFLAYAAGMLLVYLFGRFFLLPAKWLLRILANSIAGGVVIFFINFIGGNWGVFVPLNLVTAMITGILGIPGIVSLVIFFT